MINFLSNKFEHARGKNPLLEKLRFYTIKELTILKFANVFLPIYFFITANRSKNKLIQHKSEGPKIIVTLTSYPGRIKKLWLVIECILRQTQKPDEIILWLSTEQFSSINILPKKLLAQRKRGLTINFCNEDLKSYKKFYYTLIKYPNDIIFTIDDDLFYRTTMIEDAYEVHKKFPHDVIANYGHKVLFDKNGFLPYEEWVKNDVVILNTPRKDIFFGSGGGTLFPPKVFHPNVLNKEIFTKLCPTADDIWLNTMIRLKGRKVVLLSGNKRYLFIKNTKQKSLYQNNITKNNVQLFAISQFCEKEKWCLSFKSLFVE